MDALFPLLRDSTPADPKGPYLVFLRHPFLADRPKSFSEDAFGANIY